MAEAVEPLALFRDFRSELRGLQAFFQHLRLELLPPKKQAVALLLRVRRVIGTIAQEHAVLRRQQFGLESL